MVILTESKIEGQTIQFWGTGEPRAIRAKDDLELVTNDSVEKLDVCSQLVWRFQQILNKTVIFVTLLIQLGLNPLIFSGYIKYIQGCH